MNPEYEIFFYNMKKEFGNINYHLYEIVKIYNSLITNIENLEKDEKCEKLEKDKEDDDDTQEEKEGKKILKMKFFEFLEHYNSKIDETNTLEQKIDNMIQENCEHSYIYDIVDSGLDNSTSIEYCTKCNKVRE